jgi:para-aminobenzoate synthetase / 4-amino-4-deoxychorismate lyase
VEPGGAWVEFDGWLPPLAFGAPREVVAAFRLEEVEGVVRAVERAARGGAWAVGYVAYEAAPAFDPALRTRAPDPAMPLAWFGLHDAPAHAQRPRAGGGATLGPLAPELSRAEHAAAVESLRESMAAGDAYQVNLTFRLRGSFAGDPLALHDRLRAAQGGGLTACLRVGDSHAIVSASPELFLARRGRLVTARPMKGTARRGRFAEEDAAAAAALLTSEKERAENVMIADLVRNDLGRVAVPGSVRVASLLELERWRTVLQLTSTVEATLRAGVGLWDLLAATFPCGSVTGAPKASAMGLVARHERSPRGPYCGAVGVVQPGGDATLNVPIRTVALDLVGGRATAAVGGGITWASSAPAEWDEALAKAAFLSAASSPAGVRLLETLRLEGGRIPLLEGHLDRLSASAAHLGFACDRAAVRALLAREAGDGRLRLLLSRDGTAALERAPFPSPPAAPPTVALAAAPVSSRDVRLFHKTTDRAPYDAARRARPDAFDVLLWNEAGEVTEFTIGNVVLELGGERVTPPRTAGLLAGVQRARLLGRGEIRERPVEVAEALRAKRVWLVNALRGWVPVVLARP